MTSHKAILELALSLIKRIEALPMHEKQAVLLHMGQMLQTEKISADLAQMETQREIAKALQPTVMPPITDEHYRA